MTSDKVYLDGRMIGHILREERIFQTKRSPQHFFKKFCGFGFNKKVIDKLCGLDFKIHLYYEGATFKLYVTTPEVIKQHGELWDNEGEEQYIIHKKYLNEFGETKLKEVGKNETA